MYVVTVGTELVNEINRSDRLAKICDSITCISNTIGFSVEIVINYLLT